MFSLMHSVEVANLALGRLGSFSITSLSENSAEARLCSNFFDSTRRSVMREFPWNFATTWTTLSMIDGESGFGFNYAYQLPGDYLRALAFDGTAAGTKQNSWRQANGKIYSNQTNADSATLEYIRDVTDVTLWDDDFCVAFSYYLAAAIAPAMKQDPGVALGLLQAGQKFLQDAKGTDTQEDALRVIKGTELSPYQAARRGYSGANPNFLLADWGPPQ